MKKAIKARLLKGLNPTKKQADWLRDNFDYEYTTDCPMCQFNLRLYLDVNPRIAVNAHRPQHKS